MEHSCQLYRGWGHGANLCLTLCTKGGDMGPICVRHYVQRVGTWGQFVFDIMYRGGGDMGPICV